MSNYFCPSTSTQCYHINTLPQRHSAPVQRYKTEETQWQRMSLSLPLRTQQPWPQRIHFQVRVCRGSTGFPFWIFFSLFKWPAREENSQPNLSKCLQQYPLPNFKELLAVVKLVLFNLDICPPRLRWPTHFTSPASNQIIITLGYYRLELDLSEWFQSAGIHYQ